MIIEHIIKKIKLCLPIKYSEFQIHEPTFDKKDINNVKNCIESTFVSTKGKYIDSFTSKLKNITGCKKILLTSSGTSALFLALKTINIDSCEVLLPSMTFVATANAVVNANGIPNFIDSSETTLNLCPIKLEEYLCDIAIVKNKKCINKNTGRVIKGLIIVHTYGDLVDLLSIRKITKKYCLEVIEDGAGALGSYQNKKHIGITNRFSILSFNGNKIITTGMGGAILFQNNNDYELVKHLISTARISHNWKVEHDKVGYNLRMSNINAALGDNQLSRIKEILKYKRNLYLRYQNQFQKDDYCFLHENKKSDKPNHWVTNIYLKNKYKKYHQDLIKALHKEKILVRELWKPQHLNKMYRSMPKSSLNNAVNHWKTGISLPSSYYK